MGGFVCLCLLRASSSLSDPLPLQAAHAVFRLREPHIVPLLAALSISFLGVFTLCLVETGSMLRSFGLTSGALISFATCLYVSMIGYRVFFSPLQHFPGPTLAAVSKFWYLYHSTKGNMPQVMHSLNRQYGDIVRIGPNELTIFSLDAMESILGSKGKMTKGPWYVVVAPYRSSSLCLSQALGSTVFSPTKVEIQSML